MKELISVLIFMAFITFNLYATPIGENYLGVPLEVLEHNPCKETRKYPDWVMFIEKKLDCNNKCIIEGQVRPYNQKYGPGEFKFQVDDYRWDMDDTYKKRVLEEINLLFEKQYKGIGPKHWRKRIC